MVKSLSDLRSKSSFNKDVRFDVRYVNRLSRYVVDFSWWGNLVMGYGFSL